MRCPAKVWVATPVLYLLLSASVSAIGQPVPESTRRQAANDISSHQYANALSLLRNLLRANPKDASLWTLQGVALDGLGQTRESLASYDRALLLDHSYLPALEGAAQTSYLHKQTRATRDVLKLLAVDPQNPVAHAMAGALAYLAGDCASSVRHFQESGEAALNSVTALSEFSSCLLKTGKPQEAVDLLSQGLQRVPANLQLVYNLAVADLANHDPSKAIEALTASPIAQDAGSLNLLAEAYVEADRPDDAFRTLNQAIAIQPDAESNYLDLAILCLEHNKEEMAVSASSAGIGKVTNPASLYLMRGVAYAQLGQYANAEADFLSASKVEPDQPHGTIAMSLLLSDRNQVDKEKELLLQQLKRTPNDAVTNYLLADLLIRLGAAPGQPAFSQAKAYLTASLKSKADSVEAQILMSKLVQDEGDTEGALSHLQLALKLEPANRTALYRSFLLLQRLHRRPEATGILLRLKSALQSDLKKGGAGGQIQVDAPHM